MLRISGIAFLATTIAMLVTLLAVAGSAAGLVESEADLVSGLRVEGLIAAATGLVTAATLLELRHQARQSRLCVVVDATGIAIADAGSQRKLCWEDITRVYLTYTGQRDHVLWIETREAEEAGGFARSRRAALKIKISDALLGSYSVQAAGAGAHDGSSRDIQSALRVRQYSSGGR